MWGIGQPWWEPWGWRGPEGSEWGLWLGGIDTALVLGEGEAGPVVFLTTLLTFGE